MMNKWDGRFIELAQVVATWSKDPSSQIGAVIVRPDKTVASVGFNGFPKGCDDAEEIYADRPRKYSRVVHAEENAVLHTHEPLDGYIIYVTAPPCDRCTASIIQTGIKTIKHAGFPGGTPERWQTAIESSQQMCSEAGVEVISFDDEQY